MWQLFDKTGKHIGSASIEPCSDDLAERGEFAVAYDSVAAVLTANPETHEVTQLPPQPDAWHVWDGNTWTLPPEAAARRFAGHKAAMLGRAATEAQAFIDQAAGLADVPDFEIQTWETQAAEAMAWRADNSAATPMLDTIAAARGIGRVVLIKKAAAKAAAFRLLTAHVAGQRQGYETAINAATNIDGLAAIDIRYTAPPAADTESTETRPSETGSTDGTASAAIEDSQGSTAIESSGGSMSIGD